VANINRVILTGNLTADPELSTLPSGTSVCRLRLAVNRRYKDQSSGEWTEKPNYFDIKVWGAQGENCAQYLSKGRPVAVDGRLEWSEWEAQDGGKRSKVEVVADTVQFLGSRGGVRRRHPVLGGSDAIEAQEQAGAGTQARSADRRLDSPKALLFLQGEGRGDRLQELQPAAPVHVREGQDPVAADLRGLPPPPASGGRGGQARP
jgi:single-strand DNA-binding protein